MSNKDLKTLLQQLQFHLSNKKYCTIKRQTGETDFVTSNGYILDYSNDFVLMQQVMDFKCLGYIIFPMYTLKEVRFNNNDKYYNKILVWEKEVELVSKKYDIDLMDWTTIFKTIKKTGLNVIIENEDPNDESFDIGPIIRITKTAVFIRYFNARGYLNAEPTKIRYDQITIVQFDNPYINVFSKYLRERKDKSS